MVVHLKMSMIDTLQISKKNQTLVDLDE